MKYQIIFRIEKWLFRVSIYNYSKIIMTLINDSDGFAVLNSRFFFCVTCLYLSFLFYPARFCNVLVCRYLMLYITFPSTIHVSKKKKNR